LVSCAGRGCPLRLRNRMPVSTHAWSAENEPGVCAAGCLPSLVQCLVVFPLQSLGVGGVRLGLLMPVLVLAFNTAGWSFPAYWLWTASGAPRPPPPPPPPSRSSGEPWAAWPCPRPYPWLPGAGAAAGYDSLDEMDGFGFSPVSSLGS
jgi:hypothetical protein